MVFPRVIFASFACASLAHASGGLVLGPGQSATLIDVSDPSMHVVVSAKASILSIVIAAQVQQAGTLVESAEGTIMISAVAAPAYPTALGDRAVLVFNEGRYVGVAEQAPVGAAAQSAGASSLGSVNLEAVVSALAARSATPSLSIPVAAQLNTSMPHLPGPGAVVSGAAAINSTIGTVTFTQQAGGSAVLNRVSGQSPQVIHGNLTSGGTVQLTNPSGVTAGGSTTTTGSSALTTGATVK